MSPMVITTFTFACTALVVGLVAILLNDTFFRYRSTIRERVSGLSNHGAEDNSAALFDLKQLAAVSSKQHSDWRRRLDELLEQGGFHIEHRTLLSISGCVATAFALVLYGAMGKWWIALLGFFLGLIVPLLYVQGRRKIRIRRMTLQLPDAFDAMARAVRAGQTVPAAFQLVADQFPPPLCDEFWYCYEQQNLGIPYDIALKDLARRSSVIELRILVVALLVQQRSGGNLIELLANLSSIVRKRIKMQQRMKALTGEARMQAIVLIFLPILALAALSVLSPDYGEALFQRPWLLAVTGLSELFGAVWIRHLVQIEA